MTLKNKRTNPFKTKNKTKKSMQVQRLIFGGRSAYKQQFNCFLVLIKMINAAQTLWVSKCKEPKVER